MTLLKILFFIVIFLGGLYLYTNYANTTNLEGLTTMDGELRCPNLLIQKGSKYFLYNTKIAKVPGVNPIEFNNLEEYVEFLEWQRGAGIRCPVLYLQNSYDAQGERVYKIRPSVTELQGGLPPTTPVTLPIQVVNGTQSTTPSNKENIPNYEQTTYYTTPNNSLDKTNENLLFSANPMDDNWGGAAYTEALVNSGYYAGDEVSLYVP
jgi:hypothetical protein